MSDQYTDKFISGRVYSVNREGDKPDKYGEISISDIDDKNKLIAQFQVNLEDAKLLKWALDNLIERLESE